MNKRFYLSPSRYLLIILTLSLGARSQSFPGPVNWPLPNGGSFAGGQTFGYTHLSGNASPGNDTGSQTWSAIDMDGDDRPDLVICAQMQGGNVTCFSPGSGPYWRVFLNTGVGFSTTAVTWALPPGGRMTGSTQYGFNAIAGVANSSESLGSQTWSLLDMNGDKRPDLVVTAQLQSGNVTSFSPASGQYWKVYLNTGSGFSTNATTWALPNGGKINVAITYGFDLLSQAAMQSDDLGSQSWTTTDIDGDMKPDLVVCAQKQGSDITSFSPTTGQYWKVFLNNGNGFSLSSAPWPLPNGGRFSGSVTYGYNMVDGVATSADDIGSQTWSLRDLDGDKKPDLCVLAQLQSNNVTCFSPGNSAYWKVFLNTTNGFSSTATVWSLPNGGRLAGNVIYGFDALNGTAAPQHDQGSQSWSLADLNGDGKSDLVVTAQLQGTATSCFSPGSNPYWKLFINTGAGFSTISENIALPGGGKLTNGTTYGFNNMSGSPAAGDDLGSQAWQLVDMNGNKSADIVVSAQIQSGNVLTSFSPSSGQFWKVFTSDIQTVIHKNRFVPERISVYPNPSDGNFSVLGGVGDTIKVYDNIGRLILVIDAAESNHHLIRAAGLSPGAYLVRTGDFTVKLLIAH
jgi:hypothetical protein